MKKIVSKEGFDRIVELSKDLPWIMDKSEQFIELYDVFCKTEADKSLIIELLNKFLYLNGSQFEKKMHSFVEDIATTPNVFDHDTMIVSMSADANSDSGQYILYYIKPILESYNWRKHKTVNTYGKAYSEYKRTNPVGIIKNLILIDEFIGGGSTAMGRYKELTNTFSSKNININIFVRSVVATRNGIDLLSSEGINVSSQIIIDKGISGKVINKSQKNKIKVMYKLEDKLSKVYEGRKLPRLGFSRAESLYSREGGNTPNNVFPVFWWPFLETKKQRKVMFIRAMGDA
ncbi:hypothetical protein N3553_18420 [Pantoea dispersa]|uniref:phosphoribosyltransferase-like protein n=1 Tax=Pantoea dispersa TaxID=59814 RepID=UPI0021AF1EA0|nr:hypothetical protein [Pantoea dispersa]MCT6591849.1 hypothetical protein [Pantoea dispersa]